MMLDQYINNYNVVVRLVREYQKYKQLIVAVDFDNTLYDYHNEGHSYRMVSDIVNVCKDMGFYIIVFTASPESRYEFIAKYLDEQGVPFDSINGDAPFLAEDQKGTRKPYYSIFLDDRAGLSSAYSALADAIMEIDRLKSIEGRKKS